MVSVIKDPTTKEFTPCYNVAGGSLLSAVCRATQLAQVLNVNFVAA